MTYELEIENRTGGGIYVFVDDKRIDTLQEAGTTRYALESGPHIAYCRIIGMTSEILRVDGGNGDTVKLICDPRKKGEFLLVEGKNIEVLAPIRENPTWILIPILVMIAFLFLWLICLSVPAEDLPDVYFLAQAAIVLAVIAGSMVLGVAIAQKAAKRPVPSTFLPAGRKKR